VSTTIPIFPQYGSLRILFCCGTYIWIYSVFWKALTVYYFNGVQH